MFECSKYVPGILRGDSKERHDGAGKLRMLDSALYREIYESVIIGGRKGRGTLSTEPLRAFESIFFVFRKDSIFLPCEELSRSCKANSTLLNWC